MPLSHPKSQFYESLRQADLLLSQSLAQQSNRYTILRTVVFILMIFAFAAGYDGMPAGTVLGLLMLLLFCSLVRRHDRLRSRQILLRSHLSVTDFLLDRFDGGWKNSAGTGESFRQAGRPQETDLHIFGQASLYQYLCFARTLRGRQRLARALTPLPPAVAKITARQKAVAELIEHPRFCLDLAARGALLPDGHDTSGLLADLQQEPPSGRHAILRSRTAWILPALTMLSLLLAGFDKLSWSVPGLLASLQFLLALLFYRQNQQTLAPLADLTHELHLYEALFRELEETSFHSPALAAMRQYLKETGASKSLHQLAVLTDRVAQSRNLFFFLIANTLLLWDCHCAAAFKRWREKAVADLSGWIDAWSEMEVLLSLAVVGHTRKVWTFPTFSEAAPSLAAKGITSLLIAEEHAVPNDAAFAAETSIITGSNMSGKTTYLRTLASSAILAYAGAPVCAIRFSLTPMPIYTSIQVSDDLSQGISTFYAELLRIKRMVEASRRKTPLFLCIDEIFKGTNSADRIVGAREAIRQLTRPWCITLVTTHDFELCDLRSPNEVPVTNYHFEEYYEDDKIKFDYTIKPGRCQTTNARYLLKMAGILADDIPAGREIR